MSYCLCLFQFGLSLGHDKRYSSFADLESPRILMSFPRRHQVVIAARHESGAASSDGASSYSNAMQSWGSTTAPHHRPDDIR